MWLEESTVWHHSQLYVATPPFQIWQLLSTDSFTCTSDSHCENEITSIVYDIQKQTHVAVISNDSVSNMISSSRWTIDSIALCLYILLFKKCTYHFTEYICTVLSLLSCSYLILIGCQGVCDGCIRSATDLWVSVATGVPSNKHLLPLSYNADLSCGQWGKLASPRLLAVSPGKALTLFLSAPLHWIAK